MYNTMITLYVYIIYIYSIILRVVAHIVVYEIITHV